MFVHAKNINMMQSHK